MENSIPKIGAKQRRNFPIPKQVNHFILRNYGLVYYGSKNYSEKLTLLNQIHEDLKPHGYSIKVDELERRLKNMKSHYRRKKEDYDSGVASKVEWEYYNVLDEIFTNISPKKQQKMFRLTKTTNNFPDYSRQKIKEESIASIQKRKITEVMIKKEESLESFINPCDFNFNETSEGPVDMYVFAKYF